MSSGYNNNPAAAPPAHNRADSIIKESRRAHLIGGVPKETIEHWAVPDGYKIETVPLVDTLREDPKRRHGTVSLNTLDSLILYLNRFKGPASLVYCSADFTKGSAQFVAVLNDHGVGLESRAGYRDWRALYAPKTAPEWAIWTGHNGKPMQQAQFAAFLEDNMPDIRSAPGKPTGGEMLAMALNLEITQDAAFKSALRLQSGGVELTYLAKPDDTSTARMAVFERFMLGIPPFLGGPSYEVEAKLRYRLQGGACTFWYELIRPDVVVADAVAKEIARLYEDTQVPVLMGSIG